uniref:site-specific DNA-methyltransferase (adenine-specific) n=1 Tax=Candidatus Kentrum sp. LFY TaxID=2126342 RepID=A0A450U7J2_9GAMM|nr:MAG: Methyltransferase domain-containing protein [Candidatus Kentron sp. LFY]
MTLPQPSPRQLLDEAIRSLDLRNGCLLPAAEIPSEENRDHWLEKGDWLVLAKRVHADSIFFVGNDPVVVLAELPEQSLKDAPKDEHIRRFFNRIWSMARPQFLFLASHGKLEAYQLTSPPVGRNAKLQHESRLLALANTITEVQEKFRHFRRDRLETGAIYGDKRFGSGADRADRALVRDLREVRGLLTRGDSKAGIEGGLDVEYAHSLIARALFVRYLEDREIITQDYFWNVAGENGKWRALLDEESEGTFEEPELANRFFFRVLRDKKFTYALFDRLDRDFNGDILPVAPSEYEAIISEHIELLRKLLIGDSVVPQRRLFLFAYRFDIVPIELISSIYEEFYTVEQGKGNTQGTYYTPPTLAEYLLSQVLTKEVLDKKPRVIDPACGSGIFLVESFRRMVRHALVKKVESREEDGRLSRDDLRAILTDRIAGIDINPEAARIAAFSLSLAWLHYQEQRDIDANRQLPNLRWQSDRESHDPSRHLDILYAGNAFEVVQNLDDRIAERFGVGCADVVVGNPPWGAVKENDTLGKAAWAIAEKWCDPKKGRAVGGKEQSQPFVHLALELLRDDGAAGMLLSSGVLFKQHKNSQKFRQSWLTRCSLGRVVNFAHVRHLYFTGKDRAGEGIAPFILATFTKGAPEMDHRLSYWSAKHTDIVGKTRAIILTTSDMHWLFQDEVRRRDWLWKLYWWGSSRDENLVRTIQRFYPLVWIEKEREGASVISSEGYKVSDNLDAGWLSEYRSLPPRYPLGRYGKILDEVFVDVPDKVQTRRIRDIYEGQRLLFRRGVPTGGKLVARLETSPFCFRHSIHGFRFYHLPNNDQKVILGILWSSVARYYLWLTAGSWGMWHDEIHLHMIREFPIVLPDDPELQARIVRIVDELRSMDSSHTLILGQDARIEELERELDEAIFDLYVCNQSDRDLVREMCDIGLDFFYKKGKSRAVMPVVLPSKRRGVAADLPEEQVREIQGYLQVFLRIWNPDLLPDAEFAWQIMGGSASPILAVLFKLTALGKEPAWEETEDWQVALQRIAEAARVPEDRLGTIYSDTFIRVVGEHEILIIKRNERRHWTRSAALNDADATIARAMVLQEEHAR